MTENHSQEQTEYNQESKETSPLQNLLGMVAAMQSSSDKKYQNAIEEYEKWRLSQHPDW